MIVIASLHDKQRHRGQVYATTLKPVGALPLVECLRPTKDLVWGVKYRGMSGDWYIQGYRNLLVARWPAVSVWLASLTPEQDATFVCFCRPGVFCHRHLIARMLRKHRPDLELDVDAGDPLEEA